MKYNSLRLNGLNIFIFSLVVSILLVTPFESSAKIFKNSYISFDLPMNWSCELEGTEWVCVSDFDDKVKEAVIILTAKEKNETDTVDAYKAHLNQSKTWVDENGKVISSEVINLTDRDINNHTWIDGHHFQSEIQQYYTRYLATIKGGVAILVTFSAHKEHYTKFVKDFLQAIQSLKVNPKYLKDGTSAVGKRGKRKSLFENNGGSQGLDDGSSTSSNKFIAFLQSLGQEKLIGGLLILISIIGLLIYLLKKEED